MGRLRFLPCIDSEAMADDRRRELDLPRDVAAKLGQSAVAAARAGRYVAHDGSAVDWRDAVHRARAARRSIAPDDPLPAHAAGHCAETRVRVVNETTLAASKRLADRGDRPLALNFANGVKPGGGFLSGARAQEEGLCRSSALYVTLEGDPMYAAHRARPTPDSTAWAILSPDVPVFRHDDGTALPCPWQLSFVTCAAPVVPGVGQPLAGDLLRERIGRVLAIARSAGYSTLVLGAWGCGAFGNDPGRTARDFREALEGPFDGAFADIVFAITDWSADRRFLGPFRDRFV